MILGRVGLVEPVLDAGAGAGGIYHEVIKQYHHVVACDIEPRFEPCVTMDYLSYDLDYGTTIMNPPFKKWMQFVEHALAHSKKVIALGRLDQLGSIGRHDFMKATTPDVYVMSRRPSFSQDGKTDMRCYAWYVWPGTGRWEVMI